MITYEQALSEGRSRLQESGIEEYAVDGFLLMSEILGMTKTAYYMRQKDIIPDKDYEKYMTAVHRRQNREPLQYITGHAYFMGYDFAVNPDVLIPRMDTECLVLETEKIIKQSNVTDTDGKCRLLDMCTGSGCILVSLALRNPMIEGLGADISEKALKTAKENARRLQCENAEFIRSDLFEDISGKFDIIVSNPPYIKTGVISSLMEEVKTYEPYNALNGHEDGLYFYEKITKQSLNFLDDGGFLCYEIGYDQGAEVVSVMTENGFKNCRVIKDLAGLDRVVTGCLQ